MAIYTIFAINPGSTSTKIALFENDKKVFSQNVNHDAGLLSTFKHLNDQLPYRKELIKKIITENDMPLSKVSAFVGRGGGLFPMEGGTYEIDELLLDHARKGANGVQHPANLGSLLAYEFAKEFKTKAFVVNPPDVDELQDLARLTGIKEVYRVVHLHALNLKETAMRHANEMGLKYEKCNFIVCHIGGGISISAHRNGKMIDGFDIAGGEGPMTPTRCGSIAVSDLLKYLEGKDIKEVKQLCTKTGGFVHHTGISDALELTIRASKGDKYAELLWNTMLYQINKCIGSMAAVLHGKINGILIGGAMARDKDLIRQTKEACEWIAPIFFYPGEFEMEAMASGAIRVLEGTEKVKKYQGKSCFQGFVFERTEV
jgi:butyrate kinase